MLTPGLLEDKEITMAGAAGAIVVGAGWFGVGGWAPVARLRHRWTGEGARPHMGAGGVG